MAWCENQNCKKENLRKEDVEFDDYHRKVLCHGCYALHHPGWIPPSEVVDCSQEIETASESPIAYEVSLTSAEGFKASFSHGGMTVAFHAPKELLNRWLGYEAS
jgi:hypothetical protein